MKDMVDAVFRWQFAHRPEGEEGKQACRQYLAGEDAGVILRAALERAAKPRPKAEGQPVKKKKGLKGGSET